MNAGEGVFGLGCLMFVFVMVGLAFDTMGWRGGLVTIGVLVMFGGVSAFLEWLSDRRGARK